MPKGNPQLSAQKELEIQFRRRRENSGMEVSVWEDQKSGAGLAWELVWAPVPGDLGLVGPI